MIMTELTPNDQITIPRAIMKKLDINAGSVVLIEVIGTTVVIRKLEDTNLPNEHQADEKLVNY